MRRKWKDGLSNRITRQGTVGSIFEIFASLLDTPDKIIEVQPRRYLGQEVFRNGIPG